MFWKVVFFIMELMLESTNIAQKLSFSTYSLLGNNKHVNKNKIYKNKKINERFFIIGNGPSIKEQDLLFLSSENTIFVNMGYLHKDYKNILPNYHVFIDPKLSSGEWDIKILDDILRLNPNVIFFLNSKWFYHDKFQPYIQDTRYKINWIKVGLFYTRFHSYKTFDISSITYGMGVLGAAISIANYFGSKEIYLLGTESNAFCNEFTNKESHFYGLNKDNNNMSSEKIYKSLFFNYLYLMGLHNLAQKSKLFQIINCTPGGILNMFERKRLNDVSGKKYE